MTGIFYTIGSVVLALILSLVFNPTVGSVLEKMYWFLKTDFTIYPVLLAIPVFALLGWLIPEIMYRQVVKQSVVQRLRGTDL